MIQQTFNFSGKTALVTGASKGIGKAIALILGQNGAKVAVNYHSDAAGAANTVKLIRESGNEAIAIQADMSSPDDIRRLYAETIRHFGQLDIAVNNAARFVYKPVIDFTAEDYDTVFSLNVKGNLVSMQEAAKVLPDGGRIINISSESTRLRNAYQGLNAGSKAALEQLTVSMAKELGPRGITVNAVLPGYTNSDGFQAGASPEFIQYAVSQTALGRLGEPADIAAVVAFLASDAGGWVTGQRISVTGGL